MRPYLVAAGSVIGREHVRLGRNNQDGVALRVEPGLIAAAVTDGCSSSRASEAGARLGAEWLVSVGARVIASRAALGAPAEELALELSDRLVAWLGGLARGLSPTGGLERSVVGDLLLFTAITAVLTPERLVVLGIGDGLVSLDGELRVLGDGRDAPTYAAYALLRAGDLDPALGAGRGPLAPQVVYDGPSEAVTTLALATDGALAIRELLPELTLDPRLRRNSTLLHKRLVALSTRGSLLLDDTTIALIRAEPAPHCEGARS